MLNNGEGGSRSTFIPRWATGNSSRDRSCNWFMVHNKIHLISPGYNVTLLNRGKKNPSFIHYWFNASKVAFSYICRWLLHAYSGSLWKTQSDIADSADDMPSVASLFFPKQSPSGHIAYIILDHDERSYELDDSYVNTGVPLLLVILHLMKSLALSRLMLIIQTVSKLGRPLDCWSTGRPIDLTPGAWLITVFISFTQVFLRPSIALQCRVVA